MHNRNSLKVVVAGVGMGLSLLASSGARATVLPLNPTGFASIGTLRGATTYTFDTGNGASAPTVTLTGGQPDAPLFTGVISNGIAVFDFNSVLLDPGSTMTATGSLPLAILSRFSAIFNGSVDVGGVGTTGGPGGGFASVFGSGGGPGRGAGTGDGGGFGGQGGYGESSNVHAGHPYGSPTSAFLGGSAGGGIDQPAGGGGGALEVSALGDISIGGSGIRNDGAAGSGGPQSLSGGGGSGGETFLATPGQITLTGRLSVDGGAGGSGFLGGGGGGGGRIIAESAGFLSQGPAVVSEAGGAAGSSMVSGNTGGDIGSFYSTSYVSPVPEPGVAALAIGAGFGLLSRRRRD